MEIPSEIRVDRGSAGVTVVELVGEHDLAGADELAAALAEALACEGDLIVDLSESTFVDSTVIHLLCRTQRILTERGSELAARQPRSVHGQMLPFCCAARSTARMIRLWVPHRQRLSASAARTSASWGCGLRLSRSAAAMIMPLAQ